MGTSYFIKSFNYLVILSLIR